MPEDSLSRRRPRLAEPFAVAAVVALLVITGFVASHNTRRLRSHTDLVEHSHELLSTLDRVELTLKSAETGQRGFIITGQEQYLERYQNWVAAIDDLLTELESLTGDDPIKSAEIATLQNLIQQKLDELAESTLLRREMGFDVAQAMVATNIGKRTMDSIHDKIADFRAAEEALIAEREVTAATTYWVALATSLFSTFAGLVLVVGVIYLVQHNRHRAEQAAQALEAERDQLQDSLDRERRLEAENKRMDQYMRTFLGQIEDYAIFAMDADCRATTWNRGVSKVLGYDEDEFLGRDIRRLIFTPQAVAMGIADEEFDIAAAEGSANDDRWMMAKGGHHFWASGITSVVKNGNGEVVGFSKVMRDLTQRKRDQDELAELAARLSEADRRKTEFLATLAHELRNPLAPIKNAVQLMGMSELSDETEELRQTMARQIEQLIRLIDDLLDVSRIGQGKLQLKKEVVDLRSVIQAAVEASNTFISEKEQQLQVDLCGEDVFAEVDPARMTQVVSNLLNNSSRYSDNGCEIKLSLSTRREDDEQGWAVIDVSDRGIGIETDQIEDIFQMFSQGHDTLAQSSAGLGIGLTLVKTLVEVHGGTVTAESKGKGQGSTFTVCIPLAAPPKHGAPRAAEPETAGTARSFRVLIVEDLKALRTIMARLLSKLGHEVEVAEDAQTALEMLDRFAPEVIFSDISMPGMTGYDLARKLRKQPSTNQIYLVAMTGYGQSSDREQARDCGFDEHMVKPVDITKLQNLFDRLSRSK